MNCLTKFYKVGVICLFLHDTPSPASCHYTTAFSLKLEQATTWFAQNFHCSQLWLTFFHLHTTNDTKLIQINLIVIVIPYLVVNLSELFYQCHLVTLKNPVIICYIHHRQNPLGTTQLLVPVRPLSANPVNLTIPATI
jgi:hypothetical protein